MNRDEQIEISFLGMKFKSINPTVKTIILVVILLTFFVGLVALLPAATLVRLLSG